MQQTTFKSELAQIASEIDLEDVMADASQEFEVSELMERARLQGLDFEDGFWLGRNMMLRYDSARYESVKQKHSALNQRWNLDKL